MQQLALSLAIADHRFVAGFTQFVEVHKIGNPAQSTAATDGTHVIVFFGSAGLFCYAAVLAKYKYGYDDSLDAFGVHGMGGLLGALLTGVFAQKALNVEGGGYADAAFTPNKHVAAAITYIDNAIGQMAEALEAERVTLC